MMTPLWVWLGGMAHENVREDERIGSSTRKFCGESVGTVCVCVRVGVEGVYS